VKPRSARPSLTSSQVTGVDTVGVLIARSEYGATVVLAALFWLQSMNTLPRRNGLAMRDVTRPGLLRSRFWARERARSLAWLEVSPEIAASSCMPLPPEVLASGFSPRPASSGRSSSATAQQSAMPAGGPGSRSKTSRSGTPGCGSRHIGVWISRSARLAAQISVGRSPIVTCRIVSRRRPEPGTRTVGTQSGRWAGASFW